MLSETRLEYVIPCVHYTTVCLFTAWNRAGNHRMWRHSRIDWRFAFSSRCGLGIFINISLIPQRILIGFSINLFILQVLSKIKEIVTHSNYTLKNVNVHGIYIKLIQIFESLVYQHIFEIEIYRPYVCIGYN